MQKKYKKLTTQPLGVWLRKSPADLSSIGGMWLGELNPKALEGGILQPQLPV